MDVSDLLLIMRSRIKQGAESLENALNYIQSSLDPVTRVSRQAMSHMNDRIVMADDATQSFIRQHVLQLPEQGMISPNETAAGLRNFLGSTVHHARHGYGGSTSYRAGNSTADERMGLLAGRALQAGGLTAAGVGLAKLTHAYQNQFGSPADYQPMSDEQYYY